VRAVAELLRRRHRATRLSLAALAVVAGATLLATSGTAAAAGNGRPQQSISTNGSTGLRGTYNAIACTSPTACILVGNYYNSHQNQVTLTATWKGRAGSPQITPSPNPTRGLIVALSGVSCPSTKACTAVGDYLNKRGTQVTLAEAWNGTRWRIQPTPNPAKATYGSWLSGVSCASPKACVAVGYYLNKAAHAQTLAEAWNGVVWKLQATPPGPKAASSDLAGVSCPAAKVCVAVGSYAKKDGDIASLAEAWNGVKWTVQHTPVPLGVHSILLFGVSCTSPDFCMAAGDYLTESQITLAEIWNGTTWTVVHSPNAPNSNFDSLDSVSCASPTACGLAGGFLSADNVGKALGEEWNGSSWLMSTYLPHGAASAEESGTSCPSTVIGCEFAGGYQKVVPGFSTPLAGFIVQSGF
jgi:hypothetical protein